MAEIASASRVIAAFRRFLGLAALTTPNLPELAALGGEFPDYAIYATTNGVNLTDGLDGLATGAAVMSFAVYTIMSVWQFGQNCVFRLLGLSDEEANEKFGFLLEAFAYGPPPHGGIAFGWDRICMLLSGAESLRDVIAFPKTGAGFDPLTSAPTPITAQQRKEAGIDAPAAKPE